MHFAGIHVVLGSDSCSSLFDGLRGVESSNHYVNATDNLLLFSFR